MNVPDPIIVRKKAPTMIPNINYPDLIFINMY